MKINGHKIATFIENSLQKDIIQLKNKGIIPSLAIFFIGKDKASQKYVSQKLKTGKRLGIRIKLLNSLNAVSELNKDNSINGIIIQRPVPLNISSEQLNTLVIPEKDVDGFHPRSNFDPPVAMAVMEILESIHPENFLNWLKKKHILIIGRGETAGKPIAKYLNEIGLNFTVAHSQTTNLKELCLSSNIIIPCAGRANIVRRDMVSPDTILIGVGLHPESYKLKADYNEKELKDKKIYYTPVPGGIGPVNVTMLFKNLVKAATQTL